MEVSFSAYPKQCVSNALRAPSAERKSAKGRRKINKLNAWAVPLASTDVRFAVNNANDLTCFPACSHAQEGVRIPRAADSMCLKCEMVPQWVCTTAWQLCSTDVLCQYKTSQGCQPAPSSLIYSSLRSRITELQGFLLFTVRACCLDPFWMETLCYIAL